ncbi:MAG: hypothetical protein AAFZ09_13040, partial [Pseudomonadota bacterium]
FLYNWDDAHVSGSANFPASGDGALGNIPQAEGYGLEVSATANVTEAFKIITSDPNVKGILVNIFGGIMRCDVIAEGVIAAVKEVGLQVPLVVRLEGTNVELGKEIINGADVDVIAADNLADAAAKIVKAVKG